MPQEMELFAKSANAPTPTEVQSPEGYKGLHKFHKYWGKKPLEPFGFLVSRLTGPNDLVLDSFMGSGASAVEALRLGRRFIGVDINPVAVRIAALMASPPPASGVRAAFEAVAKKAEDVILESYLSPSNERPMTHYLWKGSTLLKLCEVPPFSLDTELG